MLPLRRPSRVQRRRKWPACPPPFNKRMARFPRRRTCCLRSRCVDVSCRVPRQLFAKRKKVSRETWPGMKASRECASVVVPPGPGVLQLLKPNRAAALAGLQEPAHQGAAKGAAGSSGGPSATVAGHRCGGRMRRGATPSDTSPAAFLHCLSVSALHASCLLPGALSWFHRTASCRGCADVVVVVYSGASLFVWQAATALIREHVDKVRKRVDRHAARMGKYRDIEVSAAVRVLAALVTPRPLPLAAAAAARVPDCASHCSAG
jgi:hypothetical protein